MLDHLVVTSGLKDFTNGWETEFCWFSSRIEILPSIHLLQTQSNLAWDENICKPTDLTKHGVEQIVQIDSTFTRPPQKIIFGPVYTKAVGHWKHCGLNANIFNVVKKLYLLVGNNTFWQKNWANIFRLKWKFTNILHDFV